MPTVTLILTAGIAAYKSIDLIRLLRKADYRVVPVVTEGAKQFITPLTLEAIAEHPVYDSLFAAGQESSIGHIQLARQSDLVIIAPCSADFMAKFALGFANDLPSTLLLANTAPVLIAPAMNHRMWQSEATQQHEQTLRGRGVKFIGPNEGEMACGEYGVGRMAEPQEIFAAISHMLGEEASAGSLHGRHAVVTGGPTREAIDPVRYISNYSSGKMAKAIVRSLLKAGAEVTFVHGPIDKPEIVGARNVAVQSAREMHKAVSEQVGCDIFIAVAAVADWHFTKSAKKLKKSDGDPPLFEAKKNPDILAEIARSPSRPKLVIGFAAETEHVPKDAQEKLRLKGCDWLLVNEISSTNPAFDCEDNHLILYQHSGEAEDWGTAHKQVLANRLIEKISQQLSVLHG